jgi:hypothetical protein
MPSSPVPRLPLALSSATVTADGTRSLDPGLVPQLELTISVRLLENFDIVLATTEKPREDAVRSAAEIAATGRRELHINPVLLSLLPDVMTLTGRSHSPNDDGAARSYTLTLTFSDGSATAQLWSTTFEVPRAPLVGSIWHLTVPFDHSVTPTALPPRVP